MCRKAPGDTTDRKRVCEQSLWFRQLSCLRADSDPLADRSLVWNYSVFVFYYWSKNPWDLVTFKRKEVSWMLTSRSPRIRIQRCLTFWQNSKVANSITWQKTEFLCACLGILVDHVPGKSPEFSHKGSTQVILPLHTIVELTVCFPGTSWGLWGGGRWREG